jgi:glycosidase
MHYQWYTPTRSFFAGAPPHLTASQYAAALDTLAMGMAPGFSKVLMNLTASHDTPRFSTSIYNPGKNKYRVTPREDPGYKIDRPDERTRRIQEMILVQQYTWSGAPHIWNGDEVGMWGADDPDERKPMVWADLRYDDETVHPFRRPRRHDRVEPDTALFRVYREVIALRKEHLRLLVDGSVTWLRTDDAGGLLLYARTLGDQQAVVAFNRSATPRQITLPTDGRYRLAYPSGGRTASTTLPPQSARVWIREPRQGPSRPAAR